MLTLGQSEFAVVWSRGERWPDLLADVRDDRATVHGEARERRIGRRLRLVRRGSDDLIDRPGWLAFNGVAIGSDDERRDLPALRDQDRIASQLRNHLDDVSGNFAVACQFPSGDVIIAGDSLGAAPLLMFRSDELWCVGNSMWLIEDLLRSHGVRLHRTPRLFGTEALLRSGAFGVTGYEEVELLPIGASVRFADLQDPVMEGVGEPLRHYRPTVDLGTAADRAAARFVRTVAALHGHAVTSGTRPVCDLTGGFDSRIVLAAVLNAGLKDEFGFFCGGATAGPDYRTFELLRDAAGLREDGPPPVGQPIGLEDDPVTAFRDFLYRSMGVTSDVLPLAAPVPAAHSHVHIRGGFGAHKAYNVLPGPVDDPRAATDALLGRLLWRRNRARVDPEFASSTQKGVHDFISSRHAAGMSWDQCAHQWYLETRNRDHFGSVWSFQLRSRLTFHAMYSADAVAASYSVSDEERAQGVVTYELMRRLCEPLTTFPFAKEGWDANLVAKRPRLAVVAHQRPVHTGSPRLATPPSSGVTASIASMEASPRGGEATTLTAWRAEQRAQSRPTWVAAFGQTLAATREVVHDLGSSSPVWEVFRRESALELVDRDISATWPLPDMLFCHHLLASALWQEGSEGPAPR